MADTRWLILSLVLALGADAGAATPCEEGRGQTGLALAGAEGGGLVVEAVDADSPAAESGIATGDAVVQVNAVVPRGCGDWARALRDARRERKTLLILARRKGTELPIAVAARAWDRAVAAVPAAPAEPPTVRRLVASPPPPLPEGTTVTLEEVTRGLATLAGAADRPSPRLETYHHDLVGVERQIETLAARHAVPADIVEGLRTVAGYYEAAGVAWASEEALRERQGQPRHLPMRDAATAPYFEDSDVAAAIDRFPFLRDTVAREPAPGVVGTETAGAWRPRQARTLLWEHGREELTRLTAWLSASGR